ncbi:uncharacterized protein wu:fi75a02 isoform X2 [Simochromis diagramma]|uniref:uncharacterized protein wu:fi75a02 isoform X2 n=1 Tax=Simochromis diagramma TaxID=43689 RepID=UPI001A7E467D|nr:uncharacterized protein wu:fi75a02 isoform X2 [Simochromis diagramma]
MLSRPLTLIESDGRGQNLVVMSPPHVLPLVDEDEDTQSAPTPSVPVATHPPLRPSTTSLPSSSPPCSAPPFLHLASPLPPSTPPLPPPASSSSPLAPLPPPPCCPCAALLPRLLSSHRMEVRRLLRGALASLGRRLNSLERRSRRTGRKKKNSQKQKEEGASCLTGPSVFASSSTSSFSCSTPPLPLVTISSSSSVSSSSDSEESSSSPFSSSSIQSQKKRRRRGEEETVSRRKRRRKNHQGEISVCPEKKEEKVEGEGEAEGRFVGQMAVCVRGGGEKGEPLTLCNLSQGKNKRPETEGSSQSERAINVFVRKNGYRVPLLQHSLSSQNALYILQSAESLTISQSELFIVPSGKWRFSGFTQPLAPSSNRAAFHLRVCSASYSVSPAPLLHLPAAAMEMMLDSVRGGVCCSPQRSLKDWTAPPSLSSDHCYVQTLILSPAFSAWRQQKQRSNHSTQSLYLPRRRPRPLPACSANGLPASLPADQSAVSSEFLSTNGEHGKRVSQIRIRRAPPREMLLTPMGLPKVKRIKKKEFSLEEIYTNKNYRSPANNRSLETIFEEPREKDGALLLIGQQKRRRLLLFPDFTQPRKRKRPQGAGLPAAMVPRKRAAARRHCHSNGGEDMDLDVMLVERLSALEDFLTRQGLDV